MNMKQAATIAILLASTIVHSSSECGVYLARSTIPGANLGMFAGKDFKKGETVTDGDIVIPMIEVSWHNGFEDYAFLWDEYVWGVSAFTGMEQEAEGDDAVTAASPGIGAASNSLLGLVNVADTYTQLDNAGLHRSRDPGAGAFTPYHDRESLATRDIFAGSELFIDYGEGYFSSRTHTYGLIPLYEEYERADKFLLSYRMLRDKLKLRDGLSEKLEDGLWDIVFNFSWESRTLNALPESRHDINKIIDIGTANLLQDRSTVPFEWLEVNGKCMDNIRPGRSTIPQAGRGAFATRFIPKGGIVAPAPLIHIPNRTVLNEYGVLPANKEGLVGRNVSNVVSQQLLLNYCFGHRHSSLLLSPYGVMTGLINHSSKKPNVRIEWASANTTMIHPEWLEWPLRRLEDEQHAGLAFDYVALRDIEPDEEVLIDYGEEWEDAWNDRVKNWVPPKGADQYEAAYEMNNDVDSLLWPYTEKRLPDNIRMWCHEIYRQMSDLSEPSSVVYHQCRIVDRYNTSNGQVLYMVELYEAYEHDNETSTLEVTGVLFGVPRDAFAFSDEPYTRDHALHSAFRHEMMIPDDMFPETWMDKKEGIIF